MRFTNYHLRLMGLDANLGRTRGGTTRAVENWRSGGHKSALNVFSVRASICRIIDWIKLTPDATRKAGTDNQSYVLKGQPDRWGIGMPFQGASHPGSVTEGVALGYSGIALSARGISQRLVTSSATRSRAGFTMMEIAISLAVIGIALVAIIGVLPMGMNVQQTNRQETIIGQDATVFMNAIRNGALGYDDLTNYVYAITNSWVQFAAGGTVSAQGVNGYTYGQAYNAPGYPATAYGEPLTNAANIIGLMTVPEYIGGAGDIGGDRPGQPIPCLMYGGISNHVVAYCHSISGPAVQKPPQDNPILQQDSFGYRLFCVNAPEATDTNMFAPLWRGGNLGPGPLALPGVFYGWTYWNLPAGVSSGGLAPGINSPLGGVSPWQMAPNSNLELALNLHEVRLTFEWPQLPNGKLGTGRETFRTEVAGQLQHQPSYVPGIGSIYYNPNLYVYQAQVFTNTP